MALDWSHRQFTNETTSSINSIVLRAIEIKKDSSGEVKCVINKVLDVHNRSGTQLPFHSIPIYFYFPLLNYPLICSTYGNIKCLPFHSGTLCCVDISMYLRLRLENSPCVKTVFVLKVCFNCFNEHSSQIHQSSFIRCLLLYIIVVVIIIMLYHTTQSAVLANKHHCSQLSYRLARNLKNTQDFFNFIDVWIILKWNYWTTPFYPFHGRSPK